jgi:hypothetical protein
LRSRAGHGEDIHPVLEGLHENLELAVAVQVAHGRRRRRAVAVAVAPAGVRKWDVVQQAAVGTQDDQVARVQDVGCAVGAEKDFRRAVLVQVGHRGLGGVHDGLAVGVVPAPQLGALGRERPHEPVVQGHDDFGSRILLDVHGDGGRNAVRRIPSGNFHASQAPQ